MEFYEVLEKRRSIRAFRPDPVPNEVLERLGRALYLAPTACNRQPFRFLAIRSRRVIDTLRGATMQSFPLEAPLLVAVLINSSAAWKRSGDPVSMAGVDAAIALEHLVLAATAEGLGCCWVAAFDVAKANAALKVAPPWSCFLLCPVGIPAAGQADQSRCRTRKINDIFEVVE